MIGELLRLTLTDPRAAVRRILALALPDGAAWLAFAIVVVLGLAATLVSLTLAPVEPPQDMANPVLYLAAHPYHAAAFQAAFLILLAVGVALVGRWFGGRARFGEALVLISWIEFCMICLQAVQLVLVFVLPPVALAAGLAGFALFFWWLTVFTAEANGFRNLLLVFLGIVACLMVAALVSGMVMVSLGIAPMPQPEV